MDQRSELEKLKAQIDELEKSTAAKNAYADKLERESEYLRKLLAEMKAEEVRLVAEIIRRKAELGIK